MNLNALPISLPAYVVNGSSKKNLATLRDHKLARNAQLYHYQHQKQRMIVFDRKVLVTSWLTN